MPLIVFNENTNAVLDRLASPEIFIPLTLLLIAVITWRSWRRGP
jgi:hypothetical protein